MFSEIHLPEKLSPGDLDLYLSSGWFRMGQSIFTTNFLNFKGQFYSAIWLRVALGNFTADSTQQKLIKRNKAFRTEIRPANITETQEALFAAYRQSVPFEPAGSLKGLLYGRSAHAIYDTYEVNVYDGDRLIACGYFDMGNNSAAGISSFYDPAYRKYSLGRYLIYLKMAHCHGLGLTYFYPGYFVPGYSFFDYKLEMNRDLLQYLQVSTGQWAGIDTYSAEWNPLLIMRNRLEILQALLNQEDIETSLLKYEFFDGNLIPELSDLGLFDFPLFLKGSDPIPDELGPWIVYDVRDQRYHLLQCTIIGSPHIPDEIPGHYTEHVVRLDEDLASATTAEGIVELLTSLRDTP